MNKIVRFLKKHSKIFSKVLTFFVVLLMAGYLYENREVFTAIKNFRLDYILYVILAKVIVVLLDALVNKRVIHILGKEISYKDSVLLQYSGNFLNKIISQGGGVFRGYALNKLCGLPYTKYVSATAGLYIISFISYSIIGLVSLGYIYYRMGSFNLIITLFFALLFLITLLLVMWNPHFKNEKEIRVIRLVNSVLDGWAEIKKDRRNVLLFVILAIVSLGLSAFKTVIIYKGLGVEVGFFQALYMSCITIMTTFINITPDGLGVKEGIFMFSSEIIGLDSDIILLGSLIIRAIYLIPAILFGGTSYFIFMKRLKVEKYKIGEILEK